MTRRGMGPQAAQRQLNGSAETNDTEENTELQSWIKKLSSLSTASLSCSLADATRWVIT